MFLPGTPLDPPRAVMSPRIDGTSGTVHEMAVNRSSVSIVDLGKRFDELELRLQDASLSRLERLEKKERMVELLRLCSWVIPLKAEERTALETLKAQIKARVDQLAKELQSGAIVS